MLDGNIEHRHYIECEIYFETPEVRDLGWGEASITTVKFEMEDEHLIMSFSKDERYVIPIEVLEAALELARAS